MSDSSGKPGSGIYYVILFLVVVLGGGYAMTQIEATKPMMDGILNPISRAIGIQGPAEPDDSSSPLPRRNPSTTAPPDSTPPPTAEQGAAQPPAQTTEGQPASPAAAAAAPGGLFGQPPAGSGTAPQPDSSPLSLGKLFGNPFGAGGKAAAAGPENGPVRILQKCMDKLHARDIIGAEYFVSENGKKLVLNNTIGIHKILLKFVIDSQTYDEIGYGDANITGQTTWVPIYSSLDPNGKQKRMVTAYIIMANRGDGWKIDDLYDAR